MPDFLFAPTPHAEAVDFIKSKPVVSREVFDNLLPDLRARAFLITGIESANVVQGIRDRIADIPAGANWDDVKKDIVADLHPFLANDDDPDNMIAAERRAELLMRMHGFQAYQAAQYNVMERQKDVFPYWRYQTMEDDRVRPEHAALDGIVLPADHEFWQHHYPPWNFGCRCQVIPVSQSDYDDIKKDDESQSPDKQDILDDYAQRDLTATRRLVRNGVTYNVTAPAESGKPGAFRWHPGDMRIPVEDLRARYDATTWAQFETNARKQTIPEYNLTVWEWLSGSRLIAPTAEVSLPIDILDASDLHKHFEKLDALYATRLSILSKKRQDLNSQLIAQQWPTNLTAKAVKLSDTEMKLRARRQKEAVRILTLPDQSRSKVGPANKPKKLVTSLQSAFTFLQSVVHESVFDGADVQIKATVERAHADPRGVFINGRSMGPATVVHEIGHIIEARKAALLKKSIEFRASRTIGESPRWLGPGYGRSEIALPDEWEKLGGNIYSGKVYKNYRGEDYASEIISMGMERLYRDAMAFWKSDSAYFSHVVDFIRGKL